MAGRSQMQAELEEDEDRNQQNYYRSSTVSRSELQQINYKFSRS
jgi:hypothetical protein